MAPTITYTIRNELHIPRSKTTVPTDGGRPGKLGIKAIVLYLRLMARENACKETISGCPSFPRSLTRLRCGILLGFVARLQLAIDRQDIAVGRNRICAYWGPTRSCFCGSSTIYPISDVSNVDVVRAATAARIDLGGGCVDAVAVFVEHPQDIIFFEL